MRDERTTARMEELRGIRNRYFSLDRKAKASPREVAIYRAATAELNRLAARPASWYTGGGKP